MNKNRAYTYVLPCIASTLNIDRNLIVNIYLAKKNFNDPQFVFLEFKKDKNNLEYLKSHAQVEDFGENNNNVIVKFKLNLLQFKINTIYKKGEYSLFPKSHKDSIMSYHNLSRVSEQYQILYKLPVLRHKLEDKLNVDISSDAELGVKTNLIEETLI